MLSRGRPTVSDFGNPCFRQYKEQKGARKGHKINRHKKKKQKQQDNKKNALDKSKQQTERKCQQVEKQLHVSARISIITLGS